MSCDVNLILKKNGILSNKNGSQMNKENIKIFNSYIYRINKKKNAFLNHNIRLVHFELVPTYCWGKERIYEMVIFDIE